MSARKAFTIAELMIAALILMLAVLPLYNIFISALQLRNQSREMSIAAGDLEDVLEYIKGLSFQNITVVSSGGFSNGSSVNNSVVGGFLLDNETITVLFPNGTNTDLLEIQAQVSYTGRDQRSYVQTMRTIRTNY